MMIKHFFTFFPAWSSNIMTFIHVCENTVRLLVIQKKKNRAVILKGLSVARGEEKDLEQDLDNLFREHPVKGKAVVITDDVRFWQLNSTWRTQGGYPKKNSLPRQSGK